LPTNWYITPPNGGPTETSHAHTSTWINTLALTTRLLS